MSNRKRILVAADASAGSRRAVNYVADLLEDAPDLQIGLVNFESPPTMSEWGGSEDPEIENRVDSERSYAFDEMEKESVDKGNVVLQHVRRFFAEKRIELTELLVKFEQPLDPKHLADCILKTAKEHDYETVVVGRESFSSPTRPFDRRVGEELIRNGDGVTIWIVE